MLAVAAEPEEKARAYLACSRAATACSKLSLRQGVSLRYVCTRKEGGRLTGWGLRYECTRTGRQGCRRWSERRWWKERSTTRGSVNANFTSNSNVSACSRTYRLNDSAGGGIVRSTSVDRKGAKPASGVSVLSRAHCCTEKTRSMQCKKKNSKSSLVCLIYSPQKKLYEVIAQR